jgi:hypothetical protein
VEKGCLGGGKGMPIWWKEVPGWWKRGTWVVEMGYSYGGKGVPGRKYAILGQFLGYAGKKRRNKKEKIDN